MIMIDIVLAIPAVILCITGHYVIALAYLAFIVIIPYLYFLPNRLSPEDQAFWDNNQNIEPTTEISGTSVETYSGDAYKTYDYTEKTIPEFPQ